MIAPHLAGAKAIGAEAIGPSAVVARWRLGDGSRLTLASNLGGAPCALKPPAGTLIFETAGAPAGRELGAYTRWLSWRLTVDDAVRQLARQAGIANDWVDANGATRRVAIDTLRGILAALGFPCQSKNDIAESGARLGALSNGARSFLTATTGRPVRLPGYKLDGGAATELLLEDGSVKQVKLRAVRGGLNTPAIDHPGYHRLRFSDKEITLAVAPPRCVTLDDIARGVKLFGVAVQLYSLRHAKMAESATRPHCAILWRVPRVKGLTPSRSVRCIACSRRTPRTMALIRRQAACSSTRSTPIQRCSSAPSASRQPPDLSSLSKAR